MTTIKSVLGLPGKLHKQKLSLTQSRFLPGAVPRAGTPGFCGASPGDTPSRPSWQTLDLHTKTSLGEETGAAGSNRLLLPPL